MDISGFKRAVGAEIFPAALRCSILHVTSLLCVAWYFLEQHHTFCYHSTHAHNEKMFILEHCQEVYCRIYTHKTILFAVWQHSSLRVWTWWSSSPKEACIHCMPLGPMLLLFNFDVSLELGWAFAFIICTDFINDGTLAVKYCPKPYALKKTSLSALVIFPMNGICLRISFST